MLKGVLSEERLVCEGFASSCLLDGVVATSAILAVGEMGFSAYSTFEMCANPVFGFDFLHGFTGLNAVVAALVVFGFEMFPASTQSAYWRTGFSASDTSFGFSVFVLHARFVLAGELPTEVALLEVDSFFPVIWSDKCGEHDDL